MTRKPNIGFISTWPVYQGTTILDTRSLSPSLTTVRHSTFSLGYRSVLTLLDHIYGKSARTVRVIAALADHPPIVWMQSRRVQRDMLRNVISVVRAVDNGRGIGVFYWDTFRRKFSHGFHG